MVKNSVRRTVVAGAGIGGLMAARVLSDYCESVLVIERHTLPNDFSARKEVPQGLHNHSLLEGGRRVLEKYFPGFCNELLQLGNIVVDQSAGLRWFHHGHWKIREKIDRPMYFQSRWHVEGLLRQKVREIPNIEFRQGSVNSVKIDNGKITGVETQNGYVDCDLFIDATGRTSKLQSWLKNSGLSEAKFLRRKLNLTYSTFLFPRNEDEREVMAIYPDAPNGNISGVNFPILDAQFGKCWSVSLIGRNGENPGTEIEEFLEFTRKLPVPDLYGKIKDLKPLTDKAAYFSFPHCQRIYYERQKDFPCGVIPVGDCWGFINPIYGQGMSIALMESDLLGTLLGKANSISSLTKSYLKKGAKMFDIPWTLISCEDWRYPQVEGRPPGVSLLNKYSRKLHKLGSVDKFVLRDVYDVLNFRANPLILYKPSTVLKVLFKKI